MRDDDPFADIPSAAQGLAPELKAIIDATPLPGTGVYRLVGPQADPVAEMAALPAGLRKRADQEAKRRLAKDWDSLADINAKMAHLKYRRPKASPEAIRAHTTTKEATRKRTPRQVSLHYDRRASVTGPSEPKLRLRSEYLEVCNGGISGAKAVGEGAEGVSAHSGRIPAAGAGSKAQRGRAGALGGAAPVGSGGGNSQSPRSDHRDKRGGAERATGAAGGVAHRGGTDEWRSEGMIPPGGPPRRREAEAQLILEV